MRSFPVGRRMPAQDAGVLAVLLPSTMRARSPSAGATVVGFGALPPCSATIPPHFRLIHPRILARFCPFQPCSTPTSTPFFPISTSTAAAPAAEGTGEDSCTKADGALKDESEACTLAR